MLTYTGLTEKYLQTVITVTVGASVVSGGFLCGQGVKKRGIVWGVLTGLMYGVVMIVLGMCINPDFAPGSKTALILFISLCGGGLGGVLGINF
ncbi:MAG: TIGR04086 family membrane protein [Clostridiales bacterium]|nr:TIGR04086 family membrane protein [Clostridiales bacterium]